MAGNLAVDKRADRQKIGQIWVHHTGHDETHSYGDKSREWQLDTVILLEQIERPGADIGFRLKFTKCRQRTPDNRADFEPAIVTLANDKWASERGNVGGGKATGQRPRPQIPPANERIPPGTRCVTEDIWRRSCEAGCISEGDAESTARVFRRAAKALLDKGLIGKWKSWVWIIR